MVYPMLIILVVIIIGVILFLRFTTHFHFCRRVSKKYPGEDLKGCPAWTLEGKDDEDVEHKEKEQGSG